MTWAYISPLWAGNRFLSPGMHVLVSLFPGNRFQRTGAPELLLSSCGQPGRKNAPGSDAWGKALWPSPQLEHIPSRLLSPFDANPCLRVQGSEQGVKDGRSFCETLLLMRGADPLESLTGCLSTVISGRNNWGGVSNGEGFLKDQRYLGKPCGSRDPKCLHSYSFIRLLTSQTFFSASQRCNIISPLPSTAESKMGEPGRCDKARGRR